MKSDVSHFKSLLLAGAKKTRGFVASDEAGNGVDTLIVMEVPIEAIE